MNEEKVAAEYSRRKNRKITLSSVLEPVLNIPGQC